MRYLEYKQGCALLADALGRGAVRLSQATFAWDISGNCTDAKTIELVIRPPAKGYEQYVGIDKFGKHTLYLDMDVKCRKCDECLAARRKMWLARSMQEFRRAPRTWFATLTFRPEVQLETLYKARQKAIRRGYRDFEELAPAAQFALLASVSGEHVTAFWHSVRKEDAAQIRYLAVCERHKTGLPHWHALIHETRLDQPVRKSTLDKRWIKGFAKFKLIDAKGVLYPLKYIGKDLSTRIRASIAYGRGCEDPNAVDVASQISNVLRHSRNRREVMTPHTSTNVETDL